jgi:hypothetical protein
MNASGTRLPISCNQATTVSVGMFAAQTPLQRTCEAWQRPRVTARATAPPPPPRCCFRPCCRRRRRARRLPPRRARRPPPPPGCWRPLGAGPRPRRARCSASRAAGAGAASPGSCPAAAVAITVTSMAESVRFEASRAAYRARQRRAPDAYGQGGHEPCELGSGAHRTPHLSLQLRRRRV